jgi:hypothetical protein
MRQYFKTHAASKGGVTPLSGALGYLDILVTSHVYEESWRCREGLIKERHRRYSWLRCGRSSGRRKRFGSFEAFPRRSSEGSVGHCSSLKPATSIPLRSRLRVSPAEAFWRLFEDYDRSSYRAVYTVRFKEAVYVLHVFQKKSKKGIETARADVNLIKERLKWATQNHATKSG